MQNDEFSWIGDQINKNNTRNNNNNNNNTNKDAVSMNSMINNQYNNNNNNNNNTNPWMNNNTNSININNLSFPGVPAPPKKQMSAPIFTNNTQPNQHRNEYASGVPMSKSGYIPQHIFPSSNANPSINHVPPNPMNPPNVNPYNTKSIFSNELSTGIPISKSGLPLRASKPLNPQPPKVPLNSFTNAINTSRKEYMTGISPQKAAYPMPSNLGYNIQLPQEFSTGIPMSKSGRPLKPSRPKKQNITNTNMNNVNTSFITNLNKNEFNVGIPVSKSMPMPLTVDSIFGQVQDQIETPPAKQGTKHTFKIYPSYDTIVSIQDILNKDPMELQTLRLCLEARGWCKIKYEQRTLDVIKSTMSKLEKWFNETDDKEKLKYSRKLGDGKPNPQSEYSYNQIEGFKEGLRILTGDVYKIHYENDKYPDAVKDEILKINKEFDSLSVKIMKVIYNTVYNLDGYRQFGEVFDISILNDGSDESKKLRYSMLDFVNYYNNKEYIDKIRQETDDDDKNDGNDEKEPMPNVLKSDFNVMSHSDPGLFALSFSSTNEGLEMYDEQSKKWIKIGLNEGIWWNGKTANVIDDKIKPGEHRIKIDDKTYKPRFTGWYEVSCNKQLKPEIMTETLKMKRKNKEIDDVSQNILKALNDDFGSNNNKNKNKNNNNKKNVNEYFTGISMSKSGRPMRTNLNTLQNNINNNSNADGDSFWNNF